jgi:glycosyltransferase involved in cell wall biosynthesis
MRKIAVLYVITKLELGGAQLQVLDLIRNLNRACYAPVLFTAADGLLVEEACAIKGLVVKRSRWLQRPINPLKDFFALFELVRVIRRSQIDIIHTHSSKAGIIGRLAGRLAGVKIIVHTVHGWSFHDYQSWLERSISIWLERFVGRFSKAIIVVSTHDKQRGLRCRIAPPERYVMIRYGIDYRHFSVSHHNLRQRLKIPPEATVVTMISCLKPQKSPLDFIEVASTVAQRFADARFFLVGDGILRNRLERLICKKDLTRCVSLLGWRRDIAEILASTDIFVLTSRWEGLPVAVLEALAAQKPCLVTDTGAVAEVIRDGRNGFLVTPGDIQAMSEKLSSLLADPALRQRLGRPPEESLGDNFTLSGMVESTQQLYMRLAGDRGGGYAR